MPRKKETPRPFPLLLLDPEKLEDMQNLAKALMKMPREYLIRIAGAIDFVRMMNELENNLPVTHAEKERSNHHETNQ